MTQKTPSNAAEKDALIATSFAWRGLQNAHNHPRLFGGVYDDLLGANLTM